MKRYLVAIAIWLFGCAGAIAQVVTGPIYCGASATATMTTITQVIAAPATGSARTYICGYTASSAAASNVTFQYGTGTNCGTGTTTFGPTLNLAVTAPSTDSSPMFRGMVAPASQAVCATASTSATVTIYYVQQ